MVTLSFDVVALREGNIAAKEMLPIRTKLDDDLRHVHQGVP